MTDATLTADSAQDPAEIEREIRRTQDDMSRTVDKIGSQLNARTIINALFDKAENHDIDARQIYDGARRNPLALAMIAGGTIWLISDNDAKFPSMGSGQSSGTGQASGSSTGSVRAKLGGMFGGSDGSDQHHSEYVSHMSSVEWREGEDPVSYQRRRDIARANYFMVERGHEEDETSFRQRLDDAAEKFRAKRRAWADQVSSAGSSVRDSGHDAMDRAGELYTSSVDRGGQLYQENPLVGGFAAAAIGALFGALLPTTRIEEEQLSAAGRKARELADEQKSNLTETLRGKKDELIAKVEEAAKPSQDSQGGGSGSSGGAGSMGGSGSSGGGSLGDGGQGAMSTTTGAVPV